jgi:hypothetical protein|nr:MAG TPA: hypothetical protein [Bacteriophage sp.]
MIAIRSNKELFFGEAKAGFIRMEIEEIINRPSTQTYTLRIVDTCFKEIEEEVEVWNETEGVMKTEKIKDERIQGHKTRYVTYSYNQVKILAEVLKLNKSKFQSEVEYINELFKLGLLIVTQKECKESLAGYENKGMYLSEATDWELEK